MSIIKVDNITFSYTPEGEKPKNVLSDVTLNIEQGEFVAVLGHNGSGKSTLAKHLNAILLPSGGAVYVDDMDTADQSLLFKIRERAGMVFQNPDNQIVATIVEEDVAFAPENMGLPQPEIRKRVDESLAAVGMSKFARHAPHLLSGGQKQRIAIAGVLAMKPRVIIMDEPTAMLDPSGRAEVMRTIMRLNKREGMTVVLITHHMDEAAQAERVIVMRQGIVLFEGPPKSIFTRIDELRAASLSAPQTTLLLNALNERGAQLDLSALSVQECAEQLIKFLKE